MNPSKHEVIRDSKGKFVPGVSGNPTGINAGRKPEKELEEALKKAQKRHNKSFIEYFVELAYKDRTVAIALAKKLLPDMVEGKGFEGLGDTRIIIIRGENGDKTKTVSREFSIQSEKVSLP